MRPGAVIHVFFYILWTARVVCVTDMVEPVWCFEQCTAGLPFNRNTPPVYSTKNTPCWRHYSLMVLASFIRKMGHIIQWLLLLKKIDTHLNYDDNNNDDEALFPTGEHIFYRNLAVKQKIISIKHRRLFRLFWAASLHRRQSCCITSLFHTLVHWACAGWVRKMNNVPQHLSKFFMYYQLQLGYQYTWRHLLVQKMKLMMSFGRHHRSAQSHKKSWAANMTTSWSLSL